MSRWPHVTSLFAILHGMFFIRETKEKGGNKEAERNRLLFCDFCILQKLFPVLHCKCMGEKLGDKIATIILVSS